MKKIFLFTLTISTLLATGCKKDKKETENGTTQKTEKMYSVVGETSNVNWIAYKTTEKKPVKGNFKTIKITKSEAAPTVKEAINGTSFSIPVSSLFTNEPERDTKLKKFFFGVMDNTEFITGEFKVNDTQTSVDITMNGITKTVPISDLTIEGQKATFTATLNLNDWNLQAALASINKACYDLHKGPDGISKTWDEVDIKAIIYLKVDQ